MSIRESLWCISLYVPLFEDIHSRHSFSPHEDVCHLLSVQLLSTFMSFRHLALDKKALAGHLLWLGKSHSCQNGWCNVSENTIEFLQGPALRGVGHDEWNRVGGVGGLWLAISKLHLLGVTIIALASSPKMVNS